MVCAPVIVTRGKTMIDIAPSALTKQTWDNGELCNKSFFRSPGEYHFAPAILDFNLIAV
jgi:hypothetical protein